MPFDKLKLAAMTVTDEEHVSIEEIAERLDVHLRTVERLIEKHRKKLKNWRRQGHKKLYLWSDVLKCAKIHKEIECDDTPSVAVKRAYTRQRIKELEAEVERLTDEKNNQLNSKRTN